jgi:hypothetical protein
MISFVITLAILGTLAWLAYHVVKKYRETDGTFWERLLAGFKDSATLLVAGATYVGGALIDLIGKAADALNAPEVAEMVRTQIPAEYMGYGLMGLAVVVVVARLRSL